MKETDRNIQYESKLLFSTHFKRDFLIRNHLFIQQKEEVTDWRKNVDAMSGMEGRKKLFDAGQWDGLNHSGLWDSWSVCDSCGHQDLLHSLSTLGTANDRKMQWKHFYINRFSSSVYLLCSHFLVTRIKAI